LTSTADGDIVTLNLKRKSCADDEEERKKSIKSDEEEASSWGRRRWFTYFGEEKGVA
jgi:hypothetical protein